MEKIHALAFKTIRIRGQLSEALCWFVSRNKLYNTASANLDIIWHSADDIEHIAQYVLDDIDPRQQASLLIGHLEKALLILSEFGSELRQTGKYVPDSIEIRQVISNIRTAFPGDLPCIGDDKEVCSMNMGP